MRASLLFKALVAGLVVFGLAGCFRATPYQPRDRGYGYSEQKLESNRYRVTFSGNSITSRETVENYLLYRAAELTLENGYDYFVMVSQETGADTRYQQTITGHYGLGYYYWYPYPAVAVSTSQAETAYEAQAYIVMSKGAKPETETKAFDARELKANLEAQIARPQPKAR